MSILLLRVENASVNEQRMLLLLSVSSECCLKPGDVGIYEVLPLDRLL
jgi:hypothetical protein